MPFFDDDQTIHGQMGQSVNHAAGPAASFRVSCVRENSTTRPYRGSRKRAAGGDLNDERGATPYNQLYRNLGAGQFENATAGSGADDRGYGMGVAAGDYDSDGDTDLFVTNVGPNVLLRSTGAGQFDEVTAAAGVGDGAWSASAAFVDYDRDGDLDLYATRYMKLVEGDGKGLPESPGRAGLLLPADLRGSGTGSPVSEQWRRHVHRRVLGGWTDIFVANDGSKNQLWVNQGDGTFVDQAQLRGCALDESRRAKAGMGVSAIDIDDDGTSPFFS